jgi:hypothetical protein
LENELRQVVKAGSYDSLRIFPAPDKEVHYGALLEYLIYMLDPKNQEGMKTIFSV